MMEKYFYVVPLSRFKVTSTADTSFVESLISATCKLLNVNSDQLYNKCRQRNAVCSCCQFLYVVDGN